MKKTRSEFIGICCIAVIAITLRLIHLFQISGNPFFYHPIVDALNYDTDAWHIAQTGNWLGERAYFQAPLITYFLAALYKIGGHNLLLPRLVQSLLGMLTAVGAYIIARRIFGSKAAWITGLGVACYPVLIFFDGELLPASITVFLDVAAFSSIFLLAISKAGWRWLLPGTLLGLRALATTNILATLPIFWLWILLIARQRKWSTRMLSLTLLAFTLGVAMPIAPVSLRNTLLEGRFILVSTNAGVNFYLGNSGDYNLKVSLRPGLDWDEFTRHHARDCILEGIPMPSYFFRKSLSYIKDNFSEYLRLLAYKTYLFLRGDEILRNQEIYGFRTYSSILRLLLWKAGSKNFLGLCFPFGLLLPLALPGVVLAIARRNLDALLLAGFVGAYSLSVIAFFITARYRLPIVVPMLLLLGYGWSNLSRWWAIRSLRLISLTGMVALGLLSNWKPGEMPRDMNPDAYYCLASSLAQEGDLAGARYYLEKTLELNPEDASAWLNLGFQIYERQGMWQEAERCYRRSLALKPSSGLALYNLGHIAEIQGRSDKAESLYVEAIRADPLLAAPYHNLAVIELQRKNYRKAQELYSRAQVLEPQNPRVLMGLGIVKFHTEGLSSSVRFFRQALSIDPNNPDIYYNLAIVYRQSGRHYESAQALRQVIELNPHDEQAYILFAEEMLAAGRADDAVAFLNSMRKRNPNLKAPRLALERLMRSKRQK